MLEVRKATLKDKKEIISFQQLMALETEDHVLDEKVLNDGVAAILTDASKGYYYIALQAGTVIGCLMITFEWSDWRNGNVWWIQSVFVKPSSRRQGVFTRMYEQIKREVLSRTDAIGIRLYVFRENHSAKQVYNKIGMSGDRYEVFEWFRTV